MVLLIIKMLKFKFNRGNLDRVHNQRQNPQFLKSCFDVNAKILCFQQSKILLKCYSENCQEGPLTVAWKSLNQSRNFLIKS